jgi:hypothetical protein
MPARHLRFLTSAGMTSLFSPLSFSPLRLQTLMMESAVPAAMRLQSSDIVIELSLIRDKLNRINMLIWGVLRALRVVECVKADGG